MIKKITRKILRSLLLVIIILGLFAFYGLPRVVKHFMGDEALIAWASQELGAILHRQIVINEARINFPDRLDLRGVKVSEKPTFKEGTFAQAERIILRPSLLGLFLGRVEVREASLHNVRVKVFRREDGTWNTGGVLGNKEPKVLELEARPKRLLPLYLHVDQIKIDGGEFNLTDAKKVVPDIEVHDLKLDSKDFSMDSFFKAKLSLRAKLDLPDNAPKILLMLVNHEWFALDFDGKYKLANAHPSQMAAVCDNFEVTTSSWNVKVKEGSMTHFIWSTMQANLNIVAGFNNRDVSVSSLPLHLNGTLDSVLKLARDEQANRRSFEIVLNTRKLAFAWNNILDKPLDVPLVLNLKGGWDTLISSGSLGIQAASAFGGGVPKWVYAKGQNDRWDLNLSSGIFYPQDLWSLVPALKLFHLSSGVVNFGELALAGGPKFWSLNIASATLREGYLKETGQHIDSIEGVLEHLSLVSSDTRKNISFKAALRGRGVDTAYLQAQEFLADADLQNLGGSSSRTNGEIHVYLESGGLRNVPAAVELVSFLKFLIKPLTIMQDLNAWGILKLDNIDLTSVPMENFESQYNFTDGKMDIAHLNLQSPIGHFQTKGSVDFPRDQMNILVNIALPRSRVRWKFADALIDEHGALQLSLKIKGAIEAPAVYTVLGDKNMTTTDYDTKHWDEFKEKTRKFFRNLLGR